MKGKVHSNSTRQKLLLAVLIAVLALPGITGITGIVKEKPVEGAWITPSAPEFSGANIFSGEFQRDYELWRNENTGFHYSLIRLRNQLWYSLFKTNVMPDAVIGKEGQLYLTGYISAHMGTDFVGKDAINTLTEKLRLLQDTLASHDVTLVVLLAPGKASCYPEFIPERFGPKQPMTNHAAMVESFGKSGINMLDFNSYFAKRRFTAPYPIYSNTSVHWSECAALEALDSLVKYIEKKRNIDMPSVVFEGYEWSDIPRGSDNDVGGGLNLVFPLSNYQLAYPKYHYETGKTKISMMTVADSYVRMMMSVGMVENLTYYHDYWYYNQGIEHSDGRPKTSTLDEDIYSSTMRHDVVLIMATDLNYAGFSWGYINDAYRAIVLKQPIPPEERRIRELENDIRMSKKWLYQVQQKAIARKISLDSMIRMDARFEASKEKRTK